MTPTSSPVFTLRLILFRAVIPPNFKVILVGVNDLRCDFDSDNPDGGYCWIIKKKDWDNGCNVCTDKLLQLWAVKEGRVGAGDDKPRQCCSRN